MGAHTPACLRAASDPVETVTPPYSTPLTKTCHWGPRKIPPATKICRWGERCEPGPRALLLVLFYDASGFRRVLLLLEVDAFVLVALDGGADLGRRLAQSGLLVGEKALFGAGGALGAVQAFEATAQTGMAQGPVTAAVARKLVEDIPNPGSFLVDVHLPGVLEVLTGEPRSGKDGRQGADLERRCRVIGRYLVRRVGPLRVACNGDGTNGDSQDPAEL